MKTKYNWLGVPKEVKFIATDKNAGCAFGYYNKPEMCDIMEIWKADNVSNYLSLSIPKYKGNWQDSLEERPNE